MKLISTRSAVAIVSVLVLWLAPVEAQRTTTITQTESSTTTSVVVLTTNVVCAKLVNVTGACRRRRGFPIDEPVILTFDDELDASIDEALHPVLHPQFVPTRTLGVEVTPVVVLPVVHLEDNDYSLGGGYAQHPRFSSPSAQVVRPSTSESNYSGRNKAFGLADPAKPRIYFAEINSFLSSLRDNILGSTVSITVTITNVFTETSTNIIRSSTSFFVMSCTPSPFPFVTCAAKRSLSPD